MNHREEPLNIRAKKKMKKTIRSAMAMESDSPSPRNLRGQNPAKRPGKNIAQEASRLKALKKAMEIKKKKAKSPHQKRTGPGSLEGTPSAPAYPHKEGKRWMQNTEKQTLSRAKTLIRKASKKR